MMESGNQQKGKKRSKAFYRKSAYGGAKKHCQGANILEPGIRGFLVMCNHDERSAVRESYNILNEYADDLYGPDKYAGLVGGDEAEDSDDCDDMESALKKEVEELKRASSSPMKRFQNVSTKTKNCVFIRTSLENPIEVTSRIMEDIAEKHLRKARYAARILPIIGTCKANTKDIEKLASDVLLPIFSKQSGVSYTVLFKMRNNNGTSCGRESVIPSIINVMKDINPDVTFSWTDYSTAIVIEVCCTICCMGVAPGYFRLRKYNLQELQQGPKEYTPSSNKEPAKVNESSENDSESKKCENVDVGCKVNAAGDSDSVTEAENRNLDSKQEQSGVDNNTTIDSEDSVHVEEKKVANEEAISPTTENS